jgi:hypothetical protein
MKSKNKSPKSSNGENDVREIWQRKAEEFTKNLNEKKKLVKTLILGPGYPKQQLITRRKIADRLNSEGCQVFLMEDLPAKDSTELHEKFRILLNDIDPNIIVCIFTEIGNPHGVIFEIGFICGHYGFKKTFDRLKFCVHHKTNKNQGCPQIFQWSYGKS